AHSVTLALAALGWFALPGRLVESAIAASIVVVALDALARPGAPTHPLVTFGFGLVHGLGFASMLTPLLPADAVLVPLVAFNLGIELGQLLLVAVAMPVLLVLAKRLGPHGYHRRVVRPVALLVAAAGTAWLLERALDT